MLDMIKGVFTDNGFVTAFLVIGLTMWLAYFISNKLTKGKIHGSAIAIVLGLLLAYIGGVVTEGSKGLADISFLAGIGFLGGSMLRDFAIVATSFGANFDEIKKAGFRGVISLFFGVILSFVVGVIFAYLFGYKDAVSMTTIGAGTVTYIVGPVTGATLGASSEVIAISIAAGLIKSVLVMVGTPFVAKYIGLNNPMSAMVYGGLMGTTSGVAGGLAATDPKLVPYGAVTATFYTGLGCLLAPTVLFLITNAIF
ncbi:malonate transporter subunit MadM [Ureibacillus sp. 179-F W5.1 NHS]|uniref:Malonate transporter subunit MadM n=1 Tax=Lysinibacillus halotolerans TaxID=1368476 RepID=A0A3M8H627_9BACI|nr:malonate transporter subunit MadM [Lysinibacillus halotolerans]RNC97868.1 malonate transporter subunit MadM [Lysinibacillus halotolerans]